MFFFVEEFFILSQSLSITSVPFSLIFRILLVSISIELLKIIYVLPARWVRQYLQKRRSPHWVTLLKRLHSSWSSQCLPKIEFVQKYCESWGYGTRASNIVADPRTIKTETD